MGVQNNMRIAFLTSALLLVFASRGATRTVHIQGIVGNIAEMGLKGVYTALNVRSAGWLGTASGPDPSTGYFEGELPCELVRDAHGRWVDIELHAMSFGGSRDRSMFIRVPYARAIDLGTFDWQPSRYRWKPDGLRIETGLPRDTIVGELGAQATLRISPINPTPEDTVRITVEWSTSGQPMVADHTGVYMKDCCTLRIDLRFGMRTDTDVYAESFPRRETPYVISPLAPGRYRLTQVPIDRDLVQDIDLLLSKEVFFTVGERIEP